MPQSFQKSIWKVIITKSAFISEIKRNMDCINGRLCLTNWPMLHLYASDEWSTTIFYGKISYSLFWRHPRLQSISWVKFELFSQVCIVLKKEELTLIQRNVPFSPHRLTSWICSFRQRSFCGSEKKLVIEKWQNSRPSVMWEFSRTRYLLYSLLKSLVLSWPWLLTV